jgi:DNA-binding FadR family transcriptional regulator
VVRKSVSRDRLHQQVADQLIEQIVNGDPPAGELLPSEPQLKAQFGVSRTVMREALMLLESKGLISIEHGRGNRVLSRESWGIFDPGVIEAMKNAAGMTEILEDLLETRGMFEVEAAGLAAQRSSEDTGRLTECLDTMEEELDDPVAYFRHDVEFHARLLDATHNQVLNQLMEPVQSLLEAARREVVSIASRHSLEESLVGHRKIVAAVRAGDAEAARRAMLDHLKLSQYELGIVSKKMHAESAAGAEA